MIEYLEWDSNFFRAKIGKCTCAVDLIKLLEQKEKEGYDRVYYFSQKKLTTPPADFLLVDDKVTFHKKVSQTTSIPKYTIIYEGNATSELMKLSLLSGHKSRFKTDPFFAPYFEKLYQLWLTNSLNKTFADEVLVCKFKDKVSGFITVKKEQQNGHIGLIAVDEIYHGQGLGKDLLLGTEAWYQKQDIQTCEVVTQLSNHQACKFYKSFGYKIKKVEYIYHI